MKYMPEIVTTAVSATLAVGLLSLRVANAEDAGFAEHADKNYYWGLGVAGALQRKAYTDIDDDTMVLPLIYFENRWVRFFGGSLDLKLPAPSPIEFSLAARYSRDGYEASDSRFLAGMEEREGSAWVGAAAKWSNPIADVSIEWVADPMSNSEGQQVKLELAHGFAAGKFEFTPHAGATWMDSKFVDYYYGVTTAEARAGRPQYTGESTTNVEAGLRISYSIPHQSFFVDINAEILGQEIEDSPIVDQSSQGRVVLGYLYVF